MEPTPIRLIDSERAELQARVRATKSEQRQVFRARVILMLADGMRPAAVAHALNTGANTVGKWRSRFVAERLRGLEDAPRPGKPKSYDEQVEVRILGMLERAPPRGYAKWNGVLLAKALGDVSKHQVWRVLKAHDISLERRHSWCVSTDPEFAAKAADIVGLYLNPPEHAVVLCVDEKPSIQALERAQRLAAPAQWQSPHRLLALLQASRHHHLVCRPRGGHRLDQNRPLPASPPP
jgi:transposase